MVCFDYITCKIWYDFLQTYNKLDICSEDITQGVFPPKEDDDYVNAGYLNNISNEEEESEYH